MNRLVNYVCEPEYDIILILGPWFLIAIFYGWKLYKAHQEVKVLEKIFNERKNKHDNF